MLNFFGSIVLCQQIENILYTSTCNQICSQLSVYIGSINFVLSFVHSHLLTCKTVNNYRKANLMSELAIKQQLDAIKNARESVLKSKDSALRFLQVIGFPNKIADSKMIQGASKSKKSVRN